MGNGRFGKGHKFQDLTGKRFGALTVLEVAGQDKNRRFKWKCLCDCGTFTEEFGAEMKAGHVKSCGCLLSMKRPKRVDLQEFIRRARETHGERYDYSQVKYKNTSTPVDIVCKKHGVFSQTPTQHYRIGQGCRHCAHEQKAESNRSTTEQFVKKAKRVHGDKYDYSFVDYKASRFEVKIKCNGCGDVFSQRADVHLRGNGCNACALRIRAEQQRLDKQAYLETLEGVHLEGAYSYKNTEYTGSRNRISIDCNMCGSTFTLRPDTHQAGAGCPCLTTHGFDFTKPGTFYVLGCVDITKIGITSHPIEKRIKDISNSYGREFSLIKEITVPNPRVCSDVETILLREMRKTYKQPQEKFDGYTECFYDVNLAALLNRIEDLIRECEEDQHD